jgi:hypothetical protein
MQHNRAASSKQVRRFDWMIFRVTQRFLAGTLIKIQLAGFLIKTLSSLLQTALCIARARQQFRNTPYDWVCLTDV